jgi:hypothetical protein
VALFPEEHIAPTADESIVRLRLEALGRHRPRQWGACWLACELYEQLGLDRFGAERLPPSRKGTRWDLQKIEAQYGKAQRIWVMDRGMPSEEVLAEMRASDPPVSYLVGTPKGRRSKLEADLCERPWEQVREGVEIKLLPREGGLNVFAKSRARVHQERAMRHRRLKQLLARLRELAGMKLQRDALLIKIGQAKAQAGRAFSLVKLRRPQAREAVNAQTFSFVLDKPKRRVVCRREGPYLLRAYDVRGGAPGQLWEFYMELTRIEQAFKTLKGDLAIRPIHHHREDRIEARFGFSLSRRVSMLATHRPAAPKGLFRPSPSNLGVCSRLRL